MSSIQRRIGACIALTNAADFAPRVEVIRFEERDSNQAGEKTFAIHDTSYGAEKGRVVLSIESMKRIIEWAERDE